MPFGEFIKENRSFLKRIYLSLFGIPYLPSHIKYPEIIKLGDFAKSDKILDVGCNQGLYSMSISKKYGCECIGIDLNKEIIKTCKKGADRLNIKCKFITASITKIPFKDEKFDKILCFDVLDKL